MVPLHGDVLIGLCVDFEQDVQNRDDSGKREYVQPLGNEVQYQRPSQVFAIGRNVSPHQRKELFDHKCQCIKLE